MRITRRHTIAKDKDKEEAQEGDDAKGGGKKKMIIILLPAALLLAGGGWFFFLKPDDGGVPEALPEPSVGEVVKLDPITVNLAKGSFLKLGMAIQPTAEAVELDGSKVLDLAIGQFSQMSIEELSEQEGRAKAKAELIARVKLTYLPEGTDIAAATAGASKTKTESSHSEDVKKTKVTAETEERAQTEGDSETEAEPEEINISELTGDEVLKMAEALTVQPEVYNIYFTEFVMQ